MNKNLTKLLLFTNELYIVFRDKEILDNNKFDLEINIKMRKYWVLILMCSIRVSRQIHMSC